MLSVIVSVIVIMFLGILGEEKIQTVKVTKEAEYCRIGKQSYIITEEQRSTHFKFDSIHSKLT